MFGINLKVIVAMVTELCTHSISAIACSACHAPEICMLILKSQRHNFSQTNNFSQIIKFGVFNDLDYLTDMTGTCSIGLFFMRHSLVGSAPTGRVFTSASYPQRRVTAGPLIPGLIPRGIFAFTCRDLGGALAGF